MEWDHAETELSSSQIHILFLKQHSVPKTLHIPFIDRTNTDIFLL